VTLELDARAARAPHCPAQGGRRRPVQGVSIARRGEAIAPTSVPGEHAAGCCGTPGAPGPVVIPDYRHGGLFVLLTPVWASLGGALTSPALGLSVPARFAEWLRDNGAGSVVNTAENWWYSHHQPPSGGDPWLRLYHATAHQRQRDWPSPRLSCTPPGTGSAHAVRPSRLGGRGQLETDRPPRARQPAVYATFLRPDAVTAAS